MINNSAIPHPGVGTYVEGEDITRHAYYQWVPFVLFGQAIMFYLPHYIWKRQEGKTYKQINYNFGVFFLHLWSIVIKRFYSFYVYNYITNRKLIK